MTIEQAQGAMKKIFGFDLFRPMQADIIQTIFDKKDSLVLMPTGGGKSICYQLPAILMEGSCVVVSPLISLMKDQVEALRANGINAHAINSTLDSGEKMQIHEEIGQGKVKLLYVSPEKVMTPAFLDYLTTLPLSLVAIDEAHCVSMWGNDFRPEYAQLSALVDLLPHVPVIALTATADPATQADIVKQLALRNASVFLGSFERENLHIEVQPATQRMARILRFLRDHPGEAGIIYCLSRKSTEQVAEQLRNEGYSAAHYHAKLDRQERDRVQEDFQRDNIRIICATIAFGMGIDKSNIRWIIHYNLPKNIESYYQEIGRAGRDGLPASTLLFAGFGDVMTYRMMIADSESPDEFKDVQIQKLDRMFSFSQATSCRTNAILGYFEKAGPNRVDIATAATIRSPLLTAPASPRSPCRPLPGSTRPWACNCWSTSCAELPTRRSAKEGTTGSRPMVPAGPGRATTGSNTSPNSLIAGWSPSIIRNTAT